MISNPSKIFVIILAALVLPISLAGQDNTMYMLHQLPQANMLNPAIDFPCKFYIELPVISSIKFAYNNSSFSYKDFIRQGTGTKADSLILDFDNVYSKLHRNNAIYVEFENVLIGAGFHWKKYFISARIFHDHQAGVFYNKDLIALKDGNWNPATDSPVNFDLSRNEANAISYLGISLGISKQYTSDLRIGARLNYLKGMFNYNTSVSDLIITTTEQPLNVDINASFDANVSFPMVIQHDATGRFQSFQPVTNNIIGDFIFNKNRGIALDFGIDYDYTGQTKFSASILNLGFIRWKSNSINFSAENSLTLTGVDLRQFTNNQNTDLINLLRDTVQQSLRAFDKPTKYFTPLPVKVFAGVTQQISNKIKIGMVAKIYVFNYATFPSLTATINVKPFSFIDLTGSVSYANRTLRNIGFAAIFGRERVNFYIASDMIPTNYVQETQSGVIFPYQSRSINLRFGFNLMFGCRTYKKPDMGPVCPAYKK
jgi:hypothetical protein